jgi:hypothetical protein
MVEKLMYAATPDTVFSSRKRPAAKLAAKLAGSQMNSEKDPYSVETAA